MNDSSCVTNGHPCAWSLDLTPGASAGLVGALRSVGVSVGAGPADGPGVLLGASSDCEGALDIWSLERERIIVILDIPNEHHAQEWLDVGFGDVCIMRDEATCARSVLARLKRWSDVDALIERYALDVVGRSPAIVRALREIAEYAAFGRQPVMIQGETGVGKELFAHLVHRMDAEASAGPLRILDCSTVHPELSGSEFFGHERGAFTGAVATRDGALADANGGVLFLDEVGELPERLQAELLRAVQEQTFRRVGGTGWLRSRFRLVCATHKDLEQEVAEERFRTDFYHRLAGCVCRVPSLAERPEDIVSLTRHVVAERFGAESPTLDPLLESHLAARTYPGNVRELRQLVLDCLARYPGEGPIGIGCLPRRERWPVQRNSSDLSEWVTRRVRRGVGITALCDEVKGAAYDAAISEVGENSSAIADRLGVTVRTVQLQLSRRKADRCPRP